MWSVLYIYPGGRVGAGLVLLRMGVAASGLTIASLAQTEAGWRLILTLLIALAIVAGFRTRAAALIGAIAMPLLAQELAPVQNLVLHVMGSMALALIGPGAYSVDSRLYGRRHIVFPNSNDALD